MKNLFIFYLFLVFITAHAQIGGQQTFSFLRLPATARLSGLGTENVTSGFGKDINMVAANPALLNKELNGYFSVNYLPIFAGIKQTSVAYGYDAKKLGTFGANLQYINYGTMEETDANGTIVGTFQASEFALGISNAHTLEHISLGGTIKIAGSNLANYSAYAALLDLGGIFKHPSQDLTIGFAIKNVGLVLKKYTPDSQLTLPFDVQVGGSYKAEKMPIRFSATLHHLTAFDIAYNDPTQFQLDANGNKVTKSISTGEKIFRHFTFGTEIIFSKSFNLRAGYNYLIRRELRLDNVSGGAGFSFGFMLKTKLFEFAYSRAFYHVAGATNALTLTLDTKSLLKKKETSTPVAE